MKFYIEDYVVPELLAAANESLPTVEQERDAVQRHTPLSMQKEEELIECKENDMSDFTYQFEVVTVSVEAVGVDLVREYPDEDFNGDSYKNVSIHRYLTSFVSKSECFIGLNQFGDDFVRFGHDKQIRMKAGVITRYNESCRKYEVYHISCVKEKLVKEFIDGYSKALLTVEARKPKEFLEFLVDVPGMFFCNFCHLYMFDAVEFFVGKAWDVPRFWPKCFILLKELSDSNCPEEGYITLYGSKLSICSQAPPMKKVCRRLNFDE